MANQPPRLRASQVTSLAHLLDTPPGSELRRTLTSLRLALGSESTKWRMLRESFALAQERDGHSGSVLRFVKQALDPATELAGGDLSDLRRSVNEVLLLSGFEILPDGRLVPRAPSRTADDARSRAELRARKVHPDVLAFCRSELVQRSFFHAVLETAKSVSVKIRQRTGLTSNGTALVDEAFVLKNGMPPLAFNSLQTSLSRAVQMSLAVRDLRGPRLGGAADWDRPRAVPIGRGRGSGPTRSDLEYSGEFGQECFADVIDAAVAVGGFERPV